MTSTADYSERLICQSHCSPAVYHIFTHRLCTCSLGTNTLCKPIHVPGPIGNLQRTVGRCDPRSDIVFLSLQEQTAQLQSRGVPSMEPPSRRAASSYPTLHLSKQRQRKESDRDSTEYRTTAQQIVAARSDYDGDIVAGSHGATASPTHEDVLLGGRCDWRRTCRARRTMHAKLASLPCAVVDCSEAVRALPRS